MADTTRLNKPWLLKILLFAFVLIFFGFYGLYDALVAYPRRGIGYASFKEFQYLEAAKGNHQLDRMRVSVEDPEAELSRLHGLDQVKLGPLEGPRMDWLDALSMVRRLRPEYTKIDDPEKTYQELQALWTSNKNAPKALRGYDIPAQWAYVVGGLGIGFWLLLLFANVARQKYRWDAATQTLTLPDGNALTPADIEDFDKRKWDKFLVFVRVKPAHATLGGREIKLDLYRHTPLEEWVLAMEKTAFPERAQESAAASSAAPDAPPA